MMNQELQLIIFAIGQGVLETIALSVVSFILGLIIGLVFTFLGSLANPWVRVPINGFCLMIRGLPEILLLFTAYFGGSILLNFIFQTNIDHSPFTTFVFTLAIIVGSYACKLFTAGMATVSKGEKLAAFVLGFSPSQTFFYILLPQMVRFAIPGLISLWLILLKDTALISLIGGQDLMSRMQVIIRNTGNPFTYYFILAMIYLTLTALSNCLIHFISNPKESILNLKPRSLKLKSIANSKNEPETSWSNSC